MCKKVEVEDSETNGFISYIQSVKGIELALFFRETSKENQIRVSFRSKGKIDVNSLARKFGGGGHERAAGCLMEGNIEKVEESILTAARELLNC